MNLQRNVSGLVISDNAQISSMKSTNSQYTCLPFHIFQQLIEISFNLFWYVRGILTVLAEEVDELKLYLCEGDSVKSG